MRPLAFVIRPQASCWLCWTVVSALPLEAGHVASEQIETLSDVYELNSAEHTCAYRVRVLRLAFHNTFTSKYSPAVLLA